MPWNEVSPMDQKRFFINDYIRGSFEMTELCARYKVSRPTGYKWIARFEGEGFPGLADRSRRPLTSPGATDRETVEAIVKLRRSHPHWGAKKLADLVRAPTSTGLTCALYSL